MSLPEEWKKQIPMYATYSRIFIAPLLLVVLVLDFKFAGWVAAILFIVASITDYLDGYLARRFKAESPMGQFMDPIADKILVLAALIMLLALHRVDPVMVFLLLSRDIFIGGIRSVAAANQVIIAAKPFGKWKTALQMIAVPCLFVFKPLFGVIPVAEIGVTLLWISVILSLISGTQYTVGYYRGRKTPRAQS